MILTQTKQIKDKKVYSLIDEYSYRAKNLYNACNYIIKQSSRISYKLSKEEVLENWEQEFIDNLNQQIDIYNQSGKKPKNIKHISKDNGYVVDAYFLSWYLKATEEYKQLYSVCSQQIIQILCRNWKAYYQSIKDYKRNPNKYLGKPRPPKYLDKEQGRYWLVLTNQKVKSVDNRLQLPKIFEGLKIKTDKENIQQVRLITRNKKTIVEIIYRVEEKPQKSLNNKYMGIDIGVNNLATIIFTTESTPIIVNGRPLKSINQYYNKKMAKLRSENPSNYRTNAMCKLTEKRNQKVKDYLHKASRKIVDLAEINDISKIVIGNNKGWKQEVELGKKTNQNFVSIPFEMLIQQIIYKATLQGIQVEVVEESYTSGTSYVDNEEPIKVNYDKTRRKRRGLFESNTGIEINADVNGAYQIMKKAKIKPPIKYQEKVVRVKVA